MSAWNPYPGTGATGGANVSFPAPSTAPGATAATGNASALLNSAAGVIGTTASVMVPYSATRKWLMITNRSTGAETHDIGSSNVAVGSGIPLPPGAGFLFGSVGAAGPIYGVTSVASSPFSYVEG